MSHDELSSLLQEFSETPQDADLNLEIGIEYELLGQSASAITFFLRAAEFGLESNPEESYNCILKVGLLLESLGNRSSSVEHSYLQAMSFLPYRPEAYFLLSRFHQRTGNWQQSYTFAILGQLVTSHRPTLSLVDIEYRGEYCLIFQRAVAAWWVGKKDEAFRLFNFLLENFQMDEMYINACNSNLNLWKESK